MPKENTHVYFADNVLSQLKQDKHPAAKILKSNSICFLLGAVAPDAFFYHKNPKVMAVSEVLHGKDGELTNKAVFFLLDQARSNKSPEDLALALGFVTHCILDMIFHPAIYYFSGNYYSADKNEQQRAIYLHRHLETGLDRKVNKKLFLHKTVGLKVLKKLTALNKLGKDFNLSKVDIKKSFARQKMFNRLFVSNSVFAFFRFLSKIGLVKDKAEFGLFYGNLAKDKTALPSALKYQHPVTGQTVSVSLSELFARAREQTILALAAAWDYYQGGISQKECARVLVGQSLDTGLVGVGADKAKYFGVLNSERKG